jgi:hypothetical protein
MKLRIFLTTILLLTASFSFCQSRIDTNSELLAKALQALESTTLLLEEAKEKISTLEEEKKFLETALEEEKLKKDEDLILKIEELTSKLQEAQIALENDNVILEQAKQQIIDDQKEIKDLRKNLAEAINLIEEVKTFSIGAGIVYPLGGQVLFSINIPKIPISIFTDISVQASPFNMLFSLGASYRF